MARNGGDDAYGKRYPAGSKGKDGTTGSAAGLWDPPIPSMYMGVQASNAAGRRKEALKGATPDSDTDKNRYRIYRHY